MAQLSPTAAAKTWRVGKSTIYKEMNSGSLSYVMDDKGKRVIDPSEMIRVFGEPHKPKNVIKTDTSANDRISDLKEALERQDRQQGDYIEALKAQIESQQKQLDAMTDSIDRFTRLLEHKTEQETVEPIQHVQPIEPTPAAEAPPTPQPEVNQAPPPKKKRSLLSRVLAAAIDD